MPGEVQKPGQDTNAGAEVVSDQLPTVTPVDADFTPVGVDAVADPEKVQSAAVDSLKVVAGATALAVGLLSTRYKADTKQNPYTW